MPIPSVPKLFNFLLPILLLTQLSGCATSEKAGVGPSTADMPPVNNTAAREAMRLQGHPYTPGGESPGEGFDCSGLVHYVYKKQGLNLPRDTWSLAHQLPVVQLDERQPGDLLFFTINARPLSHVGIYVGQDKFVHAPSKQTGRVMMSDLKQPYWRERFVAVRRPAANRPLASNDTANLLCRLN